MERRLLTRCTNVALVAVVGMALGHLAMPARAGATSPSRVLFVAGMATAGAIAGARERAAARDDGVRVGSALPWLAGGVAIALGLAGIAWSLVHG